MAFYVNQFSPWSGVISGNSSPGAGWIDASTAEGQKILNSPEGRSAKNQLQQGQDAMGQSFDPSTATQILNPASPPPVTVQPQPQQPTTPTTPPVVDPNQPLSTPNTPINQGTAPSDINQFIPSTSTQQQDVIRQAIEQSRGVANQNVQDLQGILNPYVTSQMQSWTNPTSPDYQQTMGQLNNFGRADPNTFAQTLSARLAPIIGQNMMQLGTSALQPSFDMQQGLVGQGAGTQSNLGLASLQRFIDMQNFDKQANLSNQLADKGIPSNFQQGVGTTSSLLGGVGDFFQGWGGLKQATSDTSYVCKELIRRKLMSESEMDDFHVHIMPAMFKKARAFWVYAARGKALVDAVNAINLDWSKFKPLLFDRVMEEKDPCKAVDLYADACRILCITADPSLWDERVLRTSFLDGLRFLPSLLCYKPFLEALAKCVRRKMLLLYDKPTPVSVQ